MRVAAIETDQAYRFCERVTRREAANFFYGIRLLDALERLIDGVEMDISGRRYEAFDDLVDYCRAVAGTIGRLCLAIFSDGVESSPGRASRLADDLGVALQLTNILRDVREDQARGGVYLPADELRPVVGDDLMSAPPDAAARVIAAQAARAADWFDRGSVLAELLDSRSAGCLLAMTGIYRRILDRIGADPGAALRGRISLPAWEKARVAARSLHGALGVPEVRPARIGVPA